MEGLRPLLVLWLAETAGGLADKKAAFVLGDLLEVHGKYVVVTHHVDLGANVVTLAGLGVEVIERNLVRELAEVRLPLRTEMMRARSDAGADIGKALGSADPMAV